MSRVLHKSLHFLSTLFLAATLHADEPGVAVAGKARFTVITPNLIRMEYAPDGKFVDLPSWYAVKRDAHDADAKISNLNGKVEIETGAIHLTYQDNGQPFSADNLHAEIKKGQEEIAWHPGLTSSQNLGGTITTLDGAREPKPLSDGILSRDGWYLLDDSHSGLFTADWISSRPKNNGPDWYLFGYGLDYRAAFRSFTAAGGAVPLPRKYTLGIWYSRYWPYSADDFKKIVQEYDQHGFPLDTIVMDMDWHLNKASIPHIDTWTGYTWDGALIPDPQGLLKWFHDQGLHVTLNDHPAAGIQAHEEMYADFMHAMGKDPATNETIPFDAGDKHYLDTSYQFSHLPREKDGVDFWWLDWQQYPNTRSVPELTNLQVLNFYNYTRSKHDDLRGQSFSRWAGWGDHRYPIEFSGDADTGWKMLAFEVPFTSTGGNVGAFFWSHDIGGHMGGRNEESYARWCQFGAFTAALRSHSTRNSEMDRRPWTYPDWAETSMRRSFRLRAEMMPYLYTSIRQGTESSVPFLHPLYVDYPEVEQAYHNGQEYLFGANLLVAPIAQPGVGPHRVATQAVWFPPGDDWYDFFTGERFTGPEEAVALDPIDTFPLYVRGGVPLPMQTFTPRPGTAPLTNLVLRCYPGRDGKTGTSEVYEDDGDTVGYEHGEFATTTLAYVRDGDETTVSVAPTKGSFKGQPDKRAYVIELPCTEKLTSCRLTGVTAQPVTTYDAESLSNWIEIPAQSVKAGWSLKVHAAVIAPTRVTKRAVARHLEEVLGEPYDAKKASGLPLEIQAACSAARGIAIIPQNLDSYFLTENVVPLYCHNHQDAPDNVTITVGDAAPIQASLRSGDPIPGLTVQQKGIPIGFTPMTIAISSPANGKQVISSAMRAFLDTKDDLALQATATASSGNAPGAIDGKVEGYPRDQAKEWSTKGEGKDAWIKLAWPQPVQASTLYLFDRPNPDDHVLAGELEFDDGTKIPVEALPNDAELPLKISFARKPVSWVKFTVTQVSPETKNIGLSEIVVSGK